MATSMGGIFPVSIRKLFDFISPSEIHSACYSVNQGVILCLVGEGDVFAVKIDAEISRGTPERILQNIKTYVLSNSEELMQELLLFRVVVKGVSEMSKPNNFLLFHF